MNQALKEKVFEANMALVERGLVMHTFGNVSAVDRDKKVVCIKPSGVDYAKMKPQDMVLLDLEGQVLEGELKPSSDTKTHLALYKGFPDIGGVAHTHSGYATAWAQAKRPLPCLGTTHADHFYGPIPCTGALSEHRIQKDYEQETGKLIIETFKGIDYRHMKAVLVACHGPFTWGKDAAEAVFVSAMLEAVARTSFCSVLLKKDLKNIQQALLDKHYRRKHGAGAYYGQKSKG